MKQVFIFSLPRSGSTLLQRALMVHDSIISISEPWLMLPQVYSYKEKGSLSEYGSLLAAKGISNLIESLPNGFKDYNESLRKFVDDLHEKLARNNEEYFLDKTPRYYLIIDEIKEIFPEAKFIFLFRSPEQIYASMIQTWANNRLRPFWDSYYDLINGTQKLSAGFVQHKSQSISINYEDFVKDPEVELRRVTDYLGLKYDPSMVHDFWKQEIHGSLGDTTGRVKYKTISDESLKNWELSFNTPFRKRIARNLIDKLASEDLSIQGYNKADILNSISEIKPKITFYEFMDIKDYYVDYFIRKFNLHLIFSKTFKWVKSKFLS